MNNNDVSKRTCALISLLALLFVSEVPAKNNHPYEGLLLVADGKFIRTFDADGKYVQDVIESDAIDIDYDCSTGELFWIEDDTMQEISVLKPGHTTPTTLLSKLDYWMPTSITFDYVTRKFFIADASSDTISLYDVYNDKSIIIVSSNLISIRKIEIDIDEGYLFVQDEVQIIRTDLDGANRQIIYQKNIMDEANQGSNNIPSSSTTSSHFEVERLSLSTITVDPKTKRVYWVDTESHQIVSINYQGTDKRIHFQFKGKWSDDILYGTTTILGNFLYWTANYDRVFKVNLYDGSYSQLNLGNVQALNIKAISCSKQPQILNPCKYNNGQCQDLCILSKSSSNNFKCVCNTGFELDDDDTSCNRILEYLIFSMESRLWGLSLSKKSDVFDPSAFDLKQSPNIDINVADEIMYYTSLAPNDKLYQVELNNGAESILDEDQSMSVRTLAYDWASRNLYYIIKHNSEQTNLCVLNVDKPEYIKMVINGLQNSDFAEIIVHPNRGYLFLSQNIEDYSNIKRVDLDGSNLVVIYQTRRRYVQATALDYQTDRIFWCETAYEEMFFLYNSDLEGHNIRQVLLPNNHQLHIRSMAIHNEFLYAIIADSSVIRLNKFGNTGEIVTLAASIFNPSVSGLKIFSPTSQIPRENHPCTYMNQCEIFCFAVPNNNGGVRGICGCPEGEVLDDDGISCVEDDYIELDLSFNPTSTETPRISIDWEKLGIAAPAA